MLRRRSFATVSATVFPAAPTTTATAPSLSRDTLLSSYSVTPPIRPWPARLTDAVLVSIIRSAKTPSLAVAALRHAALYTASFDPSPSSFAAVASKLASSAAFPLYASLLSLAPRCRLGPSSEAALLPLLNACASASPPRPRLALRIFSLYPTLDVRPSARTLNAVLTALLAARRFRLVVKLFYLSRSQFGILPDVRSCNIVLSVLCGFGKVDAALRVFEEMFRTGIAPNVVTYTTLMSGYVRMRDHERLKIVFDEVVKHGFVPDGTMYTMLIDGYCKCRMFEDACRVMEEMKMGGVKPHEATFGIMIEACCQDAKAEEALGFLNDMLDSRYVPSTRLSSKVVDTLCNNGKVVLACETWERLIKKNVMPENTILSTLIYWLCKEGKVAEARKLFDDFEWVFKPSLLTYNSLIVGLCENGMLLEAGRVWDDMVHRKLNPNVVTYDAMIRGLCKAGKVKDGLTLLQEMLRQGTVPGQVTYEALIKGIDMSRESVNITYDMLYESDEEEDLIEEIVELVASSGLSSLNADFWEVFVRNMVTRNEMLDASMCAVSDALVQFAR